MLSLNIKYIFSPLFYIVDLDKFEFCNKERCFSLYFQNHFIFIFKEVSLFYVYACPISIKNEIKQNNAVVESCFKIIGNIVCFLFFALLQISMFLNLEF